MLRFLVSLVLIVVLASEADSAYAQVHGGLKGGLNVTVLDGSINRRSAWRSTVHGGLYLTAKLGKQAAIQPELLYSGQGMKFGTSRTASTANTLRMQVLSVPMLLKLYTAKQHFYVEVGPQFSVLLSAEEERASTSNASGPIAAFTADVKDDYKTGDFGVAVGLGVEASRLVVGVRGVYGLSDINNNPAAAAFRVAQDIGGLHHRVAQAFIGLRLF